MQRYSTYMYLIYIGTYLLTYLRIYLPRIFRDRSYLEKFTQSDIVETVGTIEYDALLRHSLR